MTLISSFASPTVGFVGISDTIVSHQWSGEPPVVRLPFRPDGFRHRSGNRVISGVAQKSVILGRTLVQWSGSVDLARRLIAALDQLTSGGEQFISRHDLFANCEMGQADLNKVTLTYHHNPGGMLISKWQWKCLTENVGDTVLWYAGSGIVKYFLDAEVSSPSGRPAPEVLLSNALSLAITHLTAEAMGDDNLDDMFGGWLEFSEKIENSFGKLPYAIKLWRINNNREIVGYDPFFFCWYVEFDLLIGRIDIVDHGGPIKAKPNLFLVGDFLGRGSRQISTDPVYEPYMVGHIVLNVDTKKFHSLLTIKYEDSGFEASIGRESGFDWKASPDFMQRLMFPGEAYEIIVDHNDNDS